MSFIAYFFPLLLFPTIAALYVHLKLRSTVSVVESLCAFGLVFAVCGLMVGLSVFPPTGDTDIRNGEVVSKERNHGSYIRSYSCGCTTVNKVTTCRTCYENRYTVEWLAKTTIGNVVFDSLDRGSRFVYSTPNPKPYEECYIGEPVSLHGRFTNYIKADPDSLFNTRMETQMYSESVPPYPKVYNFYKIDRVLDVDSGLSPHTTQLLDKQLDELLKTLGRAKGVNVIVIPTGIQDPFFKHAVENQWLGGKRNDVVLFFGIKDGEVTWTDVMTYGLNGDNEMFVSTMKQKLTGIKSFVPEVIVREVGGTINALYRTPDPERYRYILDGLSPPVWVLSLCWLLSLIGTVVLTYVFHKHTDF